MNKNSLFRRGAARCGLAILMASLGATVTRAADNQALIDALVKKGILSESDANKIEAEVEKDNMTPSSNDSFGTKIKMGNWIQELDLGGDIRLRNYYTQQQQQLPAPPGVKNFDAIVPRDRWRFRLRLNADLKLDDGFFAGVELATADNRDSATQNATFTGGDDDYNIFIRKAFLGWKNDNLTIIGGRFDNPFYTTELFWGFDYALNGLMERYDFLHLKWGGQPATTIGSGKDVVNVPAKEGKDGLDLSLVAGQMVFFDNPEDSSAAELKNDAFQFETQLIGKLTLMDGKLVITEAPAVFFTNSAGVGATALLPDGKLDPASVPSGALNNANPFPISQRDELMILAPGDITYKWRGIPLTLYWDFVYNIRGNDRFDNVLGPLFTDVSFTGNGTPVFSNRAKPSLSDNLAWLIGLRVGQNKKAGDFSASVDFRQIGIAATDPNINTDDFAESNLNSQGFRIAAAYNLNDFLVVGVTAWLSWNLTGNLYGNFATGNGFPIANGNSDQVIAFDVLMKF